MTNRARIITGIFGVLLVAGIAAFFFLRYQLTKSFPPETGSLQISGLVDRVRIERDDFGVPDIEAANEHDLFFALGFVHAQDRLWQMDMMRRAGEGRMSELFGRETVPFDRMFRIVGIRRISDSIEAHLPPRTRFRLQWYSEGINAWIQESRGKYPVEFDILRYTPEPWRPLHSIIVSRMLAWELNLSWWTDLTYGAIMDRVGLQKGVEILPGYSGDVPPMVPPEIWRLYADAGKGFQRTAMAYREFVGRPLPASGSNAWVIAPARSATGSTLIANDTHLPLSAPPAWYEVRLRAPGLSPRGMTVPGIPGVLSGRNDSIAWGVTSLMADESDFYVEELREGDTTRVRYGDAWVPLTIIEEEISIRGELPEPLVVRLTRHGPIVTDIVTPLNLLRPGYVASMRWVGAEIDDQFEALFQLNKATRWREFTEALRGVTVPAQNYVYGDVRGNIGCYAAARIPLRGQRNSLFPLPGWDTTAEWTGYVPFERLPHLLNPSKGFIASANNKVVDDAYPYHIGDLWEPPSRIVRLRDVLGAAGVKLTLRDCELLQNDLVSPYARDFLPFLRQGLGDSAGHTPIDERVEQYLANWNAGFNADDIASSIFHAFLVRLIRNTFHDEMGDTIFHDFTNLTNIPLRVMARLVNDPASAWFDDVGTPQVETRDDMVRISYRQAIDDLRLRFGEDTRNWRWGEMHTVTLRHPFGLKKPLDAVFNHGPFPAGGASTALASGEYRISDPFDVVIGASFRWVADLRGEDDYRAVIPGGQSGQMLHRHCDDQIPLWRNGQYRTQARVTRTGERGAFLLEPPQ